MPHSYTNLLVHCVFGTKDRRPFISEPLQERLWPYLGGIAKENGMNVLAVGGVRDHTHMLLSLPASMPVAKAVQVTKAGSSKCIHDTFSEHRDFAWQEGYGAFSIGITQVDDTVKYIQNQAAHHERRSFSEEFEAILNRHGMVLDPGGR